MANIVLVDDHTLLRNGLAGLVLSLGHKVLFEANNGMDLIQKINETLELPDIVLLDINMPEMDGYETASWLKKNKPLVSILALSMYDNETAILRMLRNGASGYILKDSHPQDLQLAINAILNKGFYHSELISGKILHAYAKPDEDAGNMLKAHELSDKEIHFLQYACSELTYREIADNMGVSPRTVDGYRDALFNKLNIKTRVGLAVYAIKTGIFQI